MGLLSQAKREAKRLFKDIDKLNNLHKSNKNLSEKFLVIQDTFYQLKGFNGYSSFTGILQHNDELKKQDVLFNKFPISNEFKPEKLNSNDDIKMFPLKFYNTPPLSQPITLLHNHEIYYDNNLLILDDKNDMVVNLASHKNSLLITDNAELSLINSKVISLYNSKITIDPLNPLVGNIFSMKLFFGNNIFKWVHEILSFIKQNNKVIDIKNLENIFYLPQLISNYINHSDLFVELKKYLSTLFGDQNVTIENINADILNKHAINCKEGLLFSTILKNYDCFQNNPNCNFYIDNESLSILLDNKSINDKIASSILLHNIFQCSFLLNYPYSAIIVRCSMEYLSNITNYSIIKTIFFPYISEVTSSEYQRISNILFLNSNHYLINLNIDLNPRTLPKAFIENVVDIPNYPLAYRKCNKFSDLNINQLLSLKVSLKSKSMHLLHKI